MLPNFRSRWKYTARNIQFEIQKWIIIINCRTILQHKIQNDRVFKSESLVFAAPDKVLTCSACINSLVLTSNDSDFDRVKITIQFVFFRSAFLFLSSHLVYGIFLFVFALDATTILLTPIQIDWRWLFV